MCNTNVANVFEIAHTGVSFRYNLEDQMLNFIKKKLSRTLLTKLYPLHKLVKNENLSES